MAKPADSIRLVPFDPDDDAFGDFADEQGWEETDKSAHDVHQWRAKDADALVSWVTDPDTSVEFVSVEGKDRKDVAATIEKSFKMLERKDFEAYVERVPNTQGRSHGLWAVAAAAPDEPDAGVVTLIKRYLEHENPIVRRAALLAVGITGYQDFVKPVEAMLEDPDAKVRKDVEPTLQALRDAA